jgi:hypothetical protein
VPLSYRHSSAKRFQIDGCTQLNRDRQDIGELKRILGVTQQSARSNALARPRMAGNSRQTEGELRQIEVGVEVFVFVVEPEVVF